MEQVSLGLGSSCLAFFAKDLYKGVVVVVDIVDAAAVAVGSLSLRLKWYSGQENVNALERRT